MRRAVVLLAVALAAGSCKKHDPVNDEALLVAGSTTMEMYVDPVVDAFRKKYGATNVVCDPGGAGAGVVAVKRGAIDVAMVARDLTNEEDDFRMRNYLVARDGIGVVVNSANAVASLSLKQLQKIFGGEVRTWNEVGGSPGPIHVVVRERSNRTRKSFGDLVMHGHDLAEDAREVDSVAGLVDVVKLDPGAIGYLTLQDETKELKTIKIEGVEMTRLTMLSGRYPLSRSFYLSVYAPGKLAERFVQFTISKEGQDVLAAHGLVPVY